MPESVRTMDPAAAAEVLKRALGEARGPLTVADASVKSGLPLRDAEGALTFLTSEYRGHLRVTEEGELLHVFPSGFTKPWETREAASRIAAAAIGALLGAGRLLVRAWLLVVMVSYALLFVGLIIGLSFARGSDDRDHPGFSILGALLRMIADALFWTFHPFSPLYVDPMMTRGAPAPGRAAGEADDVRFYEKVNRFVFGPPRAEADPHAARALVLEEIRVRKGRVGLADVMRVTGLPREEADPLMARLMLDHDGTVEVGEQGGITYRFEAIRKTAEERLDFRRPPPAAWETPRALAPLTGNGGLANAGVIALNALNLLASAFVVSSGLTIGNIALLFSKEPPPVLPNDGVPLALGLVPFLFSLALFVIPAARALARLREERRVREENARLAIMREVLTRAPRKEPVSDEALRSAYRVATGEEPTSKAITARVVELGGDVDVGPEGEVRYRFADLEADAEALEEERARASDDEARVGRVVFASDA